MRNLEIPIVIALQCFIRIYGEPVNVNTTSGPVVGETVNVADYVVKQWLGIPYAQPPVGRRRFKPPMRMKDWTVLKSTVREPPLCYQKLKKSDLNKDSPLWKSSAGMSEDCLFLNVYTPKQFGTKPYSTIVWIGDNFYKGGISYPMFNPKMLVARTNVIVVTIQYRLGVFGFMYLGNNEAPGNMGLMDQAMALEWVSINIEQFGGTPSDVTLMGESAGAVAVGLHMVSRSTQDLFQKVILGSGSPLCSWAVAEPWDMLKRSKIVAAYGGCMGDSVEKIHECLMKKTPDQLLRGNKAFLQLSPTVDGQFVKFTPESLKSDVKIKAAFVTLVQNEGIVPLHDLMKRVKLVDFGAMSNEDFDVCLSTISHLTGFPLNDIKKASSKYFKKYNEAPKIRGNTNTKVVSQLYGDLAISCGTIKFAEAMVDLQLPTYFYYLNHRSNSSTDPPFVEVMTGDTLKYEFGAPFVWRNDFTEEDRDVAEGVMDALGTFAKDPGDFWDPYLEKDTKSKTRNAKIFSSFSDKAICRTREDFCSVLNRYSLSFDRSLTSNDTNAFLKNVHQDKLGAKLGSVFWKMAKSFMLDSTIN